VRARARASRGCWRTSASALTASWRWATARTTWRCCSSRGWVYRWQVTALGIFQLIGLRSLLLEEEPTNPDPLSLSLSRVRSCVPVWVLSWRDFYTQWSRPRGGAKNAVDVCGSVPVHPMTPPPPFAISPHLSHSCASVPVCLFAHPARRRDGKRGRARPGGSRRGGRVQRRRRRRSGDRHVRAGGAASREHLKSTWMRSDRSTRDFTRAAVPSSPPPPLSPWG
jgi:hypothetical protein